MKYNYGYILNLDGTYRHAARLNENGRAECIFWKAGEQGHEEDWWIEDWNESDIKSEKEEKEYLSQALVASKEGEGGEEEEGLDWWMEDWS